MNRLARRTWEARGLRGLETEHGMDKVTKQLAKGFAIGFICRVQWLVLLTEYSSVCVTLFGVLTNLLPQTGHVWGVDAAGDT